jgi:hypothetical protein
VVVKDTNARPRYNAAPMGGQLPKAGGPFQQQRSIFGDPRPRAESLPPREAAVQAAPAAPPPPQVRIMASAVMEPGPQAPPIPEPVNDGFLGQTEDAPPPGSYPYVAGTILLIAAGVGLVILLSPD